MNVKYIVYGKDYDIIKKAHIVIEDGIVKEISNGWINNGMNFKNAIAIPGIFNAHIHLLDAIVPEACVGYDLPGYVGSKGLKHSLIRLYSSNHDFYEYFISRELMYYSGLGDFLEIYELCEPMKIIANKYGIRYLPLSRPHRYDNEWEYLDVARKCGGIGISNPTRVPPWTLNVLARISRRTIVAAHIGETKKMWKTGALEYLVYNGVSLKHVVHGVYMDPWEYELLVEHDIVLVACPSSNLWFLGKLPDIYRAWTKNVDLAVGTDNTGCFKPDIWREVNMIYSLLVSNDPHIRSKDVLVKITRSSIKAIGINDLPWFIEEGYKANIYLIDADRIMLDRSWDIIGSIMKRASIDHHIARIIGSRMIYLR